MSELERVPDFFVVGAPKCGTTSLCSYLETHPGIFMSPVKEPHYFYSDFRPSTAPGGRVGAFARPDYYSRLFKNAADNQLCGEGSTLYLFSRFAIRDILKANPHAKLIAMVRNPLDMVVSFHGQKVYSLEEKELDFAVAWSLSEARGRGERVLPGCRAPEELNYKSMGRLGEQIGRLLKLAHPEQVHIIVFDDFLSDTAASYRGVLRFLGLWDPGTTEFPVVNARREHRVQWVSNFLRHPPPPLKQVKSVLTQYFPAELKRMGKPIRRMNTRPAAKPAIGAEMKREMAREFTDDIELLGSLLRRDLSHWYKKAL
jgi:Sulfotransferase domain